MKKVDIHTHIIPETDDGSNSVEVSREMLKMLKEQNFTDVCLTPHFDPRKEPISSFIARRNENFEKIKHLFDEIEITPHLGAEVQLQKNLFHKSDIDLLCVDNKDKILIELPFQYIDLSEIVDLTYKVVSDFSFTPVIVHPERYKAFFNENFLTEVNNAGCIVQSDIDGLDSFFHRIKIKRYFEEGLIHTFASDCHDMNERKPGFGNIRKYFSDEQIKEMLYIAQSVIE